MSSRLLWAIAGCAIAVSSWAATPPMPVVGQTLADGQSVVIAGTASDCNIAQCVRVERSGKMVYHYAIDHGQVKAVEAVELPFNAVVSPSLVTNGGGKTYSANGDTPMPPPNAPPGGTGSVIISQTYTTATDVVTIITVFTYVNGVLVGIDTREVTAPKHTKVQ